MWRMLSHLKNTPHSLPDFGDFNLSLRNSFSTRSDNQNPLRTLSSGYPEGRSALDMEYIAPIKYNANHSYLDVNSACCFRNWRWVHLPPCSR
jgi:hypothetical protein